MWTRHKVEVVALCAYGVTVVITLIKLYNWRLAQVLADSRGHGGAKID